MVKAVDLAITPDGDGAKVTFEIDLGGLPLIGPAGAAAALATRGRLAPVVENFVQSSSLRSRP